MKSRSHFEEDSASSQTLLIATEDQLDSLSNEKTRPENEWSERQQIKQALISSEVRYRRLFDC
jgi:hypothetical protein